MSKTILYINNQYIESPDEVRDLMASPQLIRNELFRREILSAYRDGILEKWYNERDFEFSIKSSSTRDDDMFIAIYKEIVKDNICPDFHSDFSKLGEFIRCEIGNNIIPLINGEIIIETINKDQSVKFVFKSLKADNNVRYFQLSDNEDIISSVECNWNDKAKGKEHYFEISFNPSTYEGKSLTLIEGNNNRLCKLVCKFPEYKEFKLNSDILKFYYVSTMKCWVGKFPRKTQFKTLDAYVKKYKMYNFKLLTATDIERLKKENKVWNKLKNSNFWVCNGQYYDSYSDKCRDVYQWQRDSERHQCWLKLKEVPSI